MQREAHEEATRIRDGEVSAQHERDVAALRATHQLARERQDAAAELRRVAFAAAAAATRAADVGRLAARHAEELTRLCAEQEATGRQRTEAAEEHGGEGSDSLKTQLAQTAATAELMGSELDQALADVDAAQAELGDAEREKEALLQQLEWLEVEAASQAASARQVAQGEALALREEMAEAARRTAALSSQLREARAEQQSAVRTQAAQAAEHEDALAGEYARHSEQMREQEVAWQQLLQDAVEDASRVHTSAVEQLERRHAWQMDEGQVLYKATRRSETEEMRVAQEAQAELHELEESLVALRDRLGREIEQKATLSAEAARLWSEKGVLGAEAHAARQLAKEARDELEQKLACANGTACTALVE